MMTKEKFIIWCMVILFIGFGFSYTIMGFGSSWDVNEGQAGVYKSDRLRSIIIAKSILAGDFSSYKREYKVEFLSGVGRFQTYPPVSALLVAPVILISDIPGYEEIDLSSLSILPFILLSGIACLLIVTAFEKYTGKEISTWAIAVISIFLFSGLLFYCTVKEGKFEGAIAFFVLAGIIFLRRRHVLSGICFGLAICTKQIAILCVIPTFFVLVREGRYRNLLKWLSGLTLVVAIVFIPFIWGSGPKDMYIAMFKNFELHKIQKDTPFGYLYMLMKLLLGDESGSIERFMQLFANKVVLSACILISLLLVSIRNIDLSAPERYFALLVVCSFLFITLGKWYTAGIYEVFPTYLLVLWAITSGENVFAAVVLLLQSFIVCNWPFALYRNQLLLLLYFAVTFYVYHKSLSAGKPQRLTLI